MYKLSNSYEKLQSLLSSEVSALFNCRFYAKIKSKSTFNPNLNWLYFNKTTPFGISDNIDISDDTNYQLLKLLLKLPNFSKSNFLINLNQPNLNLSFIIGVYEKENLEEAFSFKLAINSKYLKVLKNLDLSLNNYKFRLPKSSEKIKVLVNKFLFNNLKKNTKIRLNSKDLILKTDLEVFYVNQKASKNEIIFLIGETMPNDNIPFSIELAEIEISANDFLGLSVGSEIILPKEDLLESVINVGGNKFALAKLEFRDDEVLLRVDDIF